MMNRAFSLSCIGFLALAACGSTNPGPAQSGGAPSSGGQGSGSSGGGVIRRYHRNRRQPGERWHCDDLRWGWRRWRRDWPGQRAAAQEVPWGRVAQEESGAEQVAQEWADKLATERVAQERVDKLATERVA